MIVFLLIAAVLVATPLRAQDDPAHSPGFQHFYNLEYDEAIAAFQAQVVEQPDNPHAYNHLAQSILYKAMFRAGALESELVSGNNPFLRRPKVEASAEEQRRFDDAIQTAIRLAQERLKANASDVQALYTLGVSYGLRSNYNFLVRKAWRDALRDATTARKYHNRVTELQPGFIDARLTQGAHEFIVGSLPFHWRLLGFLVGFHGNKEEGVRLLELVAKKGAINRLDAEILLCAVYRRERKMQLAVPLLQDLIQRFPRNYLLRFELVQMYSDLGDKPHADAVLDGIEALMKKRAAGYARLQPEKVWYARGVLDFWYDDLDGALDNLSRAAVHAEDLDLNSGVLAWMRVGQIYDLKRRRPEAVEAYRKAIAFAPESDAAKESRQYLSSPYKRRG